METADKKQQDQKNIAMPQCLFCGQAIIADRKFSDAEEAAHYATMMCKCDMARKYQENERMEQERKRAETMLRESIQDFSAFCEERGHFLRTEGKGLLFDAGILVVKGIVDSVTVKIGSIRIAIRLDANGNLFFKKNYSYSDAVKVL